MPKAMERGAQQHIKYISKNKMPVEQCGGRSGYFVPDAVLKLVNSIKVPQGLKKRKNKRTNNSRSYHDQRQRCFSNMTIKQ